MPAFESKHAFGRIFPLPVQSDKECLAGRLGAGAATVLARPRKLFYEPLGLA